MRNFDYEKALLEWKKNLLKLRKKYRDTPAGFVDQKHEQEAEQRLEKEIRWYEDSHVYQFTGSYQPKEEWFFGRESDLRHVKEAVKQGPVILYGIGGVGKSALAREFVRRSKGEYDHILWLSCEKGLYSAICDDTQIRISNFRYSYEKYKSKAKYYREKMKKIKEIAGNTHLLLILDNFNILQNTKIREVFALPCDILVTTRIQSLLWKDCQKVHVRGFQAQERRELIRECQKRISISEKMANELLNYGERIQGHPLWMLLKIRDAAKKGSLEINAEDILGNLFSSLPLKNSGKQILRELSVMPAQGIPLDLYLQITKADTEEIRKLESYLLISLKEEILTLPPVVAEAARKTFHPNIVNCKRMIWGIYECVYDAWLKPYSQNQKMEPYVLAVLEAFSTPKGWMMRPLEGMVTFLWIQEYYQEARKYAHKLMKSVEKEYGPTHQNTGEMALRVAAVYHNSMDFDHARGWYVRGYEILQNCAPINTSYHHIFARACEKMGRLSRLDGNYLKALEYENEAYQSEVRFEEKSGGRAFYHEEDSAISKCGAQLEKVKTLLAMGAVREAKKYYGEIDLSVFDHQETDDENGGYEIDFRRCEFEGVWAKILFRLGKYEDAEMCMKKILEKICSYRGIYFKDALIARELLADIWRAQKKNTQAFREYGIVLEGITKEHPFQRQWIQRILDKINEE